MKQKVFFLLTLAIVATVSLKAQLNVGSTSPADVSAILQATSTTKGFLPPILTTAQVNAILLPASGLTVYNSTLSQLQVNVGTPNAPSWAVGAGGTNIYWSQVGNAGTVPGTNYIGTTDNVALTFATNGAERARITAAGNVGIGTQTPTHTLEINGSGGITGTNSLQFGVGVTGQDGAAGRIGYQAYTAGALDIVGAGTSGTNRIVKLWDNVTLPGTLTVGTTATAPNTDDLLTVNGTGTVSRRTVASLATQTPDVSIYSTDGTIATNRTVQLGGHTLTFNGNAGGFNGGLNILSGNTGLWSMLGFGRTSIEANMGIAAGAGQNLSAAATGDMMMYTGANNIQIGSNGAGAVVLSTTGAERFRVTPAGNIGISTATPLTLLSITPNSIGAKITLYDGGSTTTHFGFGISSGQLNYDVSLGTDSHVFYAGGKNGTGIEEMRINNSGVTIPVRLNMNNNLNLFVGANTGLVTTAQGNTFVGISDGQNNTSGANNTFTGYQSGYNNTTGVANTFYGFQSGYNNTITSNNLFMGFQSGFSNVNVNNNQFIGFQSGYSNNTGYENTFTGAQTGLNNTSGVNNTYTGYYTGRANTTGYNNTFTGWHSGINNTTGAGNVFYGGTAGQNTTTGNSNVFMGFNAGVNNNTGALNTAIGDQAGPNSAGLTNTTSIGANTQATQSNTVILGSGVNVGIGMTNPSRTLQVNGAVKAGLDNTGSVILNSNSTSRTGYAEWYRGNGTTRMGYIGDDPTDLYYRAENGAQHRFSGANIIVENSVGIGTSAPATRLQVVSGDNSTNTIIDAQANNLTQGAGLWYGGLQSTGSNATVDLRLDAKSTGNVLLNTNAGSGNVGIGTGGPAYKLDVVAPASSAIIRIGDGGSGGGVYFGNGNHGVQRGFPTLGSNNNVGLFTSGNIYLSGAGTNTNQFVLTNGGNVGINMGGNSPSRTLQVNASLRVGLDNNSSVILNGGNNRTGFAEFYRGDGTTRMGYIGDDPNNLLYNAENGASHYFAGGNVIVGTALGVRMAPSYTIDVSGNVRSSFDMNASAFNLTSDRRLKKHLVPLNSALDKVMQLMPYSYEKKATLAATNYDQKEMGFIAQDVLKIFPELITVGKDADKILAINYMALIPLLTKAIQEQQAQKDTQLTLNKHQQAQNDIQVALNKQQQSQIKAQVVLSKQQAGAIVEQAEEIALLKKENLVIAAQLSDMKELKIAMAQMRSDLNKTTVTQAALPIQVTVKN